MKNMDRKGSSYVVMKLHGYFSFVKLLKGGEKYNIENWKSLKVIQ